MCLSNTTPSTHLYENADVQTLPRRANVRVGADGVDEDSQWSNAGLNAL